MIKKFKKNSFKNRNKLKKLVPLFTKITPTFCGFPLITQNYNRLWRWDTLQEIKI